MSKLRIREAKAWGTKEKINLEENKARFFWKERKKLIKNKLKGRCTGQNHDNLTLMAMSKPTLFGVTSEKFHDLLLNYIINKKLEFKKKLNFSQNSNLYIK